MLPQLPYEPLAQPTFCLLQTPGLFCRLSLAPYRMIVIFTPIIRCNGYSEPVASKKQSALFEQLLLHLFSVNVSGIVEFLEFSLGLVVHFVRDDNGCAVRSHSLVGFFFICSISSTSAFKVYPQYSPGAITKSSSVTLLIALRLTSLWSLYSPPSSHSANGRKLI
jgi:hypothetical protein